MTDKKHVPSIRDRTATLLRMAANVASGMVNDHHLEQKNVQTIAEDSVAIARAIIAEVERTQ